MSIAIIIRIIIFSFCIVTLSGCSDSVDKIAALKPQQSAYLRIDATRCTSCGLCYERCTEQAIIETTINGKWIYVIDPERCIGCGACIDACPYGSITRQP